MKLIVFDLDGTLVDSRIAIAATLNEALMARGWPVVPDSASIALIGLPLWEMFPKLVPAQVDEDEVDALVAAYRGRYGALAAVHERVYLGIPALLDALAADGRVLAVATSKSTHGAQRAMRRHFIAEHFSLLLGTDAVAQPKPHPDLVERIMSDLGHGATDTVVVGDTEYDMHMGKGAGATTIAVTWGSHDRERLRAAGADHIVDTIADLAALLGVSPTQ